MNTPVGLIVIAALLIPLAGLFAAADAALNTVSRARVDALVREGRSGARALQAVVAERPRHVNLLLLLRLTAETAAVELSVAVNMDAMLNNRTANLTLLILENLVHNALKVSTPGATVTVAFNPDDHGGALCTIADAGPGLPAELLPRLFTPCRSTQGGSGLGLAISKQLANQLGAELVLQTSSASGCVFLLRLPPELFQADTPQHRRFNLERTTTE